MVYGDAGLEETADIEQRTVISKMHNMQWLKSNSQLFGHSKAFPHGNENKTETLKEDIDQVIHGSIKILSSTSCVNNPNIEQSVSTVSKDNTEKNNSASGREAELSLSVSVIQNTMEAVWSEDVSDSMLSDTQSLVLQRLDEEEMMSMALTESMVTAQLEHFRIDEDPKDTSEVACEKANTDNWDSAQQNKSDIISTIPNQENPKQCHDSNNNNAKSEIISEINTGIIKKLDWANDEGDDSINQSSATIKNNCNEKNNTCERDTHITGSDSIKSSSVENSKAEKVEGLKSRQSITGKSHVPSNSIGINKSKSITNEKQTEEDNSRRCHKVQITRTQSYNNQYIRNKALGRPQPRYSQSVAKPDQDQSRKPPGSAPSTNPGPSNQSSNQPSNNMDNRQRYNPNRVPPTRDGYHRRYDQQDSKRRETDQATSHRSTPGSYNTSGSAPTRNTTRTFEGSSSNRFDKNPSYTGNRMQQNTTSGKPIQPNIRTSNDRYDRDYNTDGQRLKRDPNVYRRSTDYTSGKYQNVKPKVDDRRSSNSGGNNTGRYDTEEAKDLLPNSADSNGNRTNETSQQNIRPPENVQHMPPEEEQFYEPVNTPQTGASNVKSNVKTSQDQEITNSSNNKANPVEGKTVKFSENVQEINIASHDVSAYVNNPPPQNRQSMNPFIDGSQNVGHMSCMQPVECLQNLPIEQYFDNTVTYSHVSPVSVHTSEHQQSQMQKDGQMVQTQSTCMPHMANVPMASGGLIHYQNHPGLYMNQYNPVHNMPRKSAEVNNMAQNTSSANNSVLSTANQSVMAGDSSNMMMHGSQPTTLPPPGFHSHPQQEQQWAIAHPDMVYFGNMMNTMHPLGMPMQNLRPPCTNDYNALQQAGYLQQPVIYMPQMCMQSWNPLMQCPGPLLQNPQYPGYNPLSHQVLPSSNLMEPVSCPVATTAQNQQYKSYQQGEGDYRKELSPQKMDACGNLQESVNKLGNTKAKDNALDVHMRASQYYKAPNDYQNTSQDTQVMSPYTYSAPIVPPMKACPLNVHSQTYQKYPVSRNVSNANYPRYSDNPHYNNRNYGRKDDSKNDSDFIPPMVSPRECMFYGINYSRKTDYMPSPTLKSEMKH